MMDGVGKIRFVDIPSLSVTFHGWTDGYLVNEFVISNTISICVSF